MSVDVKAENDRQKRAKRVILIKRILIILLLMTVILPTVLCIILFIRIHTLEQRVTTLSEINRREAVQLAIEEESQRVAQQAEEQRLEAAAAAEEKTRDENRRKIYLTFDDGPSANTGEILDILREKNIKATFFVVGKKGADSQASYKRIAAEGHTLGMHSYSHDYKEIYDSLDSYKMDLLKLQDYLLEVTGVQSRFTRFPGGSSNKVSRVDMRQLIDFLDAEGIAYFDWNISSGDAESAGISVQELVSNCTDFIMEKCNSIILMHDANNKHRTVEALPLIIDKLQEMENIEILPITEDTVPVRHVLK